MTHAPEDPHAPLFRVLAEAAAHSSFEELYLWPRTPMGYDHQEKIKERVGASDREVDDPRSRPHLIIQRLRSLRAEGALAPKSAVLDIACGDALVLWQVKRALPELRCHGVDCNLDRFGTHADVRSAGVELHLGYLQHLFASAPSVPFDVAIMLNTYRGWESAELRRHERDLPRQADTWLAEHCRFTFLTATDRQVARLRRQAPRVERLGQGEDDSSLICVRWRAIA